MLRHAFVPSTLGDLLVVAESDALTGIYFEGHWHPPKDSAIGVRVEEGDDSFLAEVAVQVREYLDGGRQSFDLSLAPQGDEFSQRVWALLRDIPRGGTMTYGELATQLGNPKLAQRVGQAVGHNPISIVIPCHRVVGTDGSLTGYAGGLERKRFLLTLEEPDSVDAGRLF